MIRIAVVILNYNGEKLLRQFLPSVIRHSPEAALYVADNGSTDTSVAVLETEFPQVSLIRLPANYGFCKGYNEALKHVVADVYLLLNSDVEVTAGWLAPMHDLFVADPQIGAVQPKILSYEKRNLFEHAGAGGGLMDLLGYPFCRGRIFNTVEEDHGQYNDERPIFWATGACMAIRSDLYHALGGLDEYFFAHMEEIDLCWKIHRAGRTVYYTGRSTVYHLGAGTLGYHDPRKTLLNFRNNLLMLYKHLDTAGLLLTLPVRMVLDWVAVVFLLLKGQYGNSLAVIKAHIAFIGILMRSSYRKKRREIRRRYPSYPHERLYGRAILVDYYLLKRRIYRDQ